MTEEERKEIQGNIDLVAAMIEAIKTSKPEHVKMALAFLRFLKSEG
jgi:hypothetical protein